ncbi:twin-arginine translocation signal domain-containing protein [Haladaptatus halobius]|uniref:twin-arginine translocation signal domain-containing protein n=1 Tax=Haladaptatus halobius TaxID=2884875 RepID=UPI001D0A96DF|nr:twin-arginine translocation signal domain-containing protein [Haladaptatus halobius]
MNGTNRREFLDAAGVLGATVTVGAEFAPGVAGADESAVRGRPFAETPGEPGRPRTAAPVRT